MPRVVRWIVAFIALAFLVAPQQSLVAQEDGRPLTLDECISIAMQNNPQLLNSERQLRLSGSGVTRARSAVLPRLDLRLSGSRLIQGAVTQLRDTPVGFQIDTLSIPVFDLQGDLIGRALSFRSGAATTYEQTEVTQPGLTRNSYSAGLNFSQTIFDGGQSWYTIKQASAGYDASENTLVATRQGVVATIMQSYFQVLKDQQLLEVFREATDFAEKQLERTQSMYELGSVSQIDVYQARVSVGENRTNFINQQVAVQNSKADLNLALGRDPLTPLEIIATELEIEPLALSLEEAERKAVESNPEVRARQLDMKAASYGLKSAKGAYLPSLSFSAGYSRFNTMFSRVYGEFDKNYNLSLGLSLSLNVFNGFSTQANVEDQSQRYLISQENYEDGIRQVKQQVQQAFLNLQRYKQVTEINDDNLKAAEEELRLAEERYRVGAGTLLDIINARVSVTRARASLVQAKYDSMIARAQLEQAMGTLQEK